MLLYHQRRTPKNTNFFAYGGGKNRGFSLKISNSMWVVFLETNSKNRTLKLPQIPSLFLTKTLPQKYNQLHTKTPISTKSNIPKKNPTTFIINHKTLLKQITNRKTKTNAKHVIVFKNPHKINHDLPPNLQNQTKTHLKLPLSTLYQTNTVLHLPLSKNQSKYLPSLFRGTSNHTENSLYHNMWGVPKTKSPIT